MWATHSRIPAFDYIFMLKIPLFLLSRGWRETICFYLQDDTSQGAAFLIHKHYINGGGVR